jgi:hypothetical protein
MVDWLERSRSVPVHLDDGRRYLAISVDGADWLVVTEDAKPVGGFKSFSVTTRERLRVQALAVIARADSTTPQTEASSR